MAKAIIGGLVNSGKIAPSDIFVYDRKADTNQALAEQYGINAAESADALAREVDILFGAVKPNVILKVLKELAGSLKKEALVVSIAAGVTLDSLSSVLGYDRKIVRAMPNTPSLVSEGMTSVTPNALVESAETDEVVAIFESFGKAAVVDE